MKKIAAKKGSALLIALMIMSSLGVATLSAAKLFLSETKTSTNISETAGAYYAAEGAIEKALLAYRQDKSVQLSDNCDNRAATDCTATSSDGWFNGGSLDNASRVYTKIYSVTGSVTGDTGINQDESKEFTIYSDDSVTFDWEWTNTPASSAGQQGLRIIYINPDTNTIDESKTQIFVDAISQSSVNISTSIPKTIIRVRPMGNSISSYTLTSTKGQIDTGVTTIDVKGEYLDVSRQLQVKINRNKDQGNTLNSLFDYTLLSDCSLDDINCAQI